MGKVKSKRNKGKLTKTSKPSKAVKKGGKRKAAKSSKKIKVDPVKKLKIKSNTKKSAKSASQQKVPDSPVLEKILQTVASLTTALATLQKEQNGHVVPKELPRFSFQEQSSDEYASKVVSTSDDTDDSSDSEGVLSESKMKEMRKLNKKKLKSLRDNNFPRCNGVTKRKTRCRRKPGNSLTPWCCMSIESTGLCRDHLSSKRRRQLKESMDQESWKRFNTEP